MKAMEKFREPLSGRSLGHIIGEYGDSGEIWKLISKYQFTDLLLFTDSHKENLFHKIVRNKGIKRLAMSTFCATSSNVIPMVDHKNSFGQTPLELAASLGRFDDLLELYGCQRTPQKMATFFAEFGVELAYRQDLAQYPELFEYLIPHLFSHSTSSKSLFEFHYESEEFSQFISSEERFFDRYMEDPEISRRLVLKRYPLHFGRVDHYGQTTIFYYALSDLEDRELLESILKHTKLDQVNFRGETIFHLFSKTGRRKELKILLKHLPASDFLLRKNSAGATALDVCVDGETCRVLRRATPVL